MIQSKESQAARPGLQPAKPGLDAVAQGDALLERAQEAQAEQTALLEASPLESQYSAAFAAQVEAKHDQAERIEDRLENLIEQQASRLQQTQAGQPGLLSRPGARAKWQSQVQQQQSAMQRLHGRLEAVREIKEGMGAHGPRIEELAHRKVRAHEPELAKDWEEMREAQCLHQALLRKQEQEKKQASERERRGEPVGRGLRLGLTQAR
ncbi:IncP plasmid survival protein KfrC family protein [Collimonas sp.]|jgi:hypothetical protein|uniref:IncP plasmid survival protein KfrC family protein n=1 Tax=Collimonas sp. TaxID=1963772 RepID=UPI0037BF077C